MKRISILGVALALVPAAPAWSASATVTGTIHTPIGPSTLANNVPVKHIRVIVVDDDVLFDDERIVHTLADGTFTATFADLTGDPDILVHVEYVGTGVDGQLIEVRRLLSDAQPLRDNDLVDQPGCADPCALGVINLTDTAANVVTHAGDAVRNLEGAMLGATTPWTMPETMLVEARSAGSSGICPGPGGSCAGPAVSIAFGDHATPGAGNDAFSDIHHEAFHWVMFKAYGDSFVPGRCPQTHNSRTETCEGSALEEASAQYFGSWSAPADNKTGAPGANDWRGADNTAMNVVNGGSPFVGQPHSGEIVEGAYELTWRLVNDVTSTLDVFLNNTPSSFRTFRDAYRTIKGAGSAQMITLLTHAAANGMVYTRGRITGFQEGAPSGGTPDPGNFEIFDNKSFVRGKINPTVVALTMAELQLASTGVVAPGQKTIGYKSANNGLGDSFNGFSFATTVPFAGNFDWDTSTVPDGEYDLIIALTSINSWIDTLRPDFTGDATMNVNTNERWLKFQGTWYDRGGTRPSTDDEGKIIIDNTPPFVRNCKP